MARRPSGAAHRLAPAGDVDHRQARVAEQRVAVGQHFARVGPARAQGRQRGVEVIAEGVADREQDAAHQAISRARASQASSALLGVVGGQCLCRDDFRFGTRRRHRESALRRPVPGASSQGTSPRASSPPRISRGPDGQSVLTTRVPQARASISTLGKPSWSEHSTSSSAPAIHG
jgi:hypothetical protein